MSSIVNGFADRRTAIHAGRGEQSAAIREDCDRVGLRGEFAFAAMSGQAVDLSEKPRGDGGIDFVVPVLRSVDVKTCEPGLNLVNPAHEPLPADIYVLADDLGDSAELVGWCWREEFVASDRIVDGKRCPLRVVGRGSLRPIEELERMLWRVPR